MRGTLSSCDKLTDDFGNGSGATRIGDRNMLCIYAEKMSPSDLRLFQQYRSLATNFALELHVRCSPNNGQESGRR
jgi:hypothetical protein